MVINIQLLLMVVMVDVSSLSVLRPMVSYPSKALVAALRILFWAPSRIMSCLVLLCFFVHCVGSKWNQSRKVWTFYDFYVRVTVFFAYFVVFSFCFPAFLMVFPTCFIKDQTHGTPTVDFLHVKKQSNSSIFLCKSTQDVLRPSPPRLKWCSEFNDVHHISIPIKSS